MKKYIFLIAILGIGLTSCGRSEEPKKDCNCEGYRSIYAIEKRRGKYGTSVSKELLHIDRKDNDTTRWGKYSKDCSKHGYIYLRDTLNARIGNGYNDIIGYYKYRRDTVAIYTIFCK